MRKSSLLVLFTFAIGFTAPVLAAPSNDHFTNSVPLTGAAVSYAGVFNSATMEPGEPSIAPTNTVWVSWNAPVTGPVLIRLSRPQLTWAAYTGDTLATLQPVPLVTLFSNSMTRFWAAAGIVYHFQISGSGTNFTLNFEISPPEPASNDDFAFSKVLAGESVWGGPTAIMNATSEIGEPAHMNGLPFRSVWWTWQAPRHGSGSVNARTSLINTGMVAIYTGETLEALSLVQKVPFGQSANFPVLGGQTFHIAAAVPTNAIGDARLEIGVGAIPTAPSYPVPGNLLLEPSWEGTSLAPVHWGKSGSIGGYVNENGGADGTTWPVLGLGAKIWQDFPTTPGHQYAVRFAFKTPGASVKVHWDANEIGVSTIPADSFEFWRWETYKVFASNSTSRVTFENLGVNTSIDAFSVVDLTAPPEIMNQPVSISSVNGGTAGFSVGVIGSAPLHYRWFFNDVLQPNETNATMVLSPVSTNHAGSYFAVITNGFGAVTSLVASLSVDAADVPVIAWQPYGDLVWEGGFFSFSVVALGTPPLAYQWHLDGDAIAGATGKTLVLTNVQTGDAGFYQVVVSNADGTVWSLPAKLDVVTDNPGGGTIDFRNKFLTHITNAAPVFNIDGVTRLNGNLYLAQLYAGPSLERLRPAGAPTPFQSGFEAGFVEPRIVTLANVPPGSNCVVQVRAWEAAKGDSYEEARAFGGRFGKSEILPLTAGGNGDPPQVLLGLESFNLTSGLPYFTTPIIGFSETLPDGTLVWSLNGEAGYLYLIERASQDFVWHPFLVVTNATGSVTFTDAPADQLQFYRGRILD